MKDCALLLKFLNCLQNLQLLDKGREDSSKAHHFAVYQNRWLKRNTILINWHTHLKTECVTAEWLVLQDEDPFLWEASHLREVCVRSLLLHHHSRSSPCLPLLHHSTVDWSCHGGIHRSRFDLLMWSRASPGSKSHQFQPKLCFALC